MSPSTPSTQHPPPLPVFIKLFFKVNEFQVSVAFSFPPRVAEETPLGSPRPQGRALSPPSPPVAGLGAGLGNPMTSAGRPTSCFRKVRAGAPSCRRPARPRLYSRPNRSPGRAARPGLPEPRDRRARPCAPAGRRSPRPARPPGSAPRVPAPPRGPASRRCGGRAERSRDGLARPGDPGLRSGPRDPGVPSPPLNQGRAPRRSQSGLAAAARG